MENKNKNRNIWKYIAYSVIIVGIVFFIYQSSRSKDCNDAYLELRSIQFKGIVQKKYIDSINHMNKLLIIQSNIDELDTIWLTADKSGLFEYLNKHDSINKDEDSYNVKVMRGNSSISFEMDYKCE